MLFDMDSNFDQDADGPKFSTVDQAEFDRLKRLDVRELEAYMAERDIDGVRLRDDPTLRIVA